MTKKDPNEQYNESRRLMMQSRGKKADGSWDTPDGKSPQTTGTNSCFPASAAVMVPGGSKPIGEIAAGEMVLAVDGRGNCMPRRVLRALRHPPADTVTISLSTGRSLVVTPNHSVWVNGRLEQAGHVRPGDAIRVRLDGGVLGVAVVESACIRPGSEAVCNLVVEQDFTFVVEGVIAHSFTRFRMARTVYWTVWVAIAARLSLSGLSKSLLPAPHELKV